MRALSIMVRFVAVVVFSAVVGTGIGFSQTQLAFLRFNFEERATFAAGSALLGAVVGAAVGPAFYYLGFRGRATAAEIVSIVAVMAGVGCGSAVALALTVGYGWPSVIVTGVCSVLLFAMIAVRSWTGGRSRM